jgi:hypothetical protein
MSAPAVSRPTHHHTPTVSTGEYFPDLPELNHREHALLRAVADGRGELLCGCEPDLAIDGYWCDFIAARRLVHTGLIRPSRPQPVGNRAPAEITETGRAALVTA